ncbi:hypothetical protein LOTGIDRAFT_176059 [Lottia gigantea]|uniref:EGF-like domain-containing protein n=1 Tax=Lottia gigantea TaxID=225164 RepID=V3ZN27_LOTGI|nr:hypothetical protein LOTGIDRAFT_176059 [Lottia gigantea]ESO85727.1 hypothetical protein LOTGIDRAFT_176059 [Lottia gigantea]
MATCALKSLNGFSIHVNRENETPELCYKDNIVRYTTPAVNNIECSQVITGRYVNISNFHINRDARYLVLCEVEIDVISMPSIYYHFTSVCSNGTFGSDCNNFCHCLNYERCSENAECPGECADGWTGTTCNQSILYFFIMCQ